jgi:hypothetical protein
MQKPYRATQWEIGNRQLAKEDSWIFVLEQAMGNRQSASAEIKYRRLLIALAIPKNNRNQLNSGINKFLRCLLAIAYCLFRIKCQYKIHEC